jgi:hypothetical protein
VQSSVEGDEVVVTTTHFSNWFSDRWADLRDRVVPDAQDRFDRLLSAAGEGKHPRCENVAAVRADGYTVTSDAGRRVYWCLGRENGAVVLKTVNARGYGVAAEATPGLSDATVDSPWNWLADRLTAPPYKRGNHVDVVPSGTAATFTIDEEAIAGSAAGVTFRADAGAYLITTVAFSVDTMAMLLTKTGTGKTKADIVAALKGASCLNAFTSLATTSLTSPADAQSFLSDALTMSFDCVEAVVRDFDFGWVLQGVVQPLMWLWSGVLTAVNGVVAAVDTGSETFGVVGYTIKIAGPPQADTIITTINPFTDSGLKRGWSLDTSQQDSGESLDCYGSVLGADSGSPYAVGPGTHDCGTTASATPACWSAQLDVGSVWCLSNTDPYSRTLRVLSAVDIYEDTAAPAEPRPMFVELDDGSVWFARIGGAWSGRSDHWEPAFGCSNDVGLCAEDPQYFIVADPDGAPVVADTNGDGVWEVTVGTTDIHSGFGAVASPLETRRVAQAWFVAGRHGMVAAPEPFYCSGTCEETDTRGDAPAQADLLGARVSSSTDAFTVTFQVRDLPDDGNFAVGAGLSGWGVNYFVSKTPGGIVVEAQTVSETRVFPKETCTTATVVWQPAENEVEARFPYACSGDSPDGGTVINGIDFQHGTAKDSMGKIFYRP